MVRDGALTSFAASGLAATRSGTPITEDTVFRIGSITKTFTAIALLQLQERGLVDLDAPAADYLRTFPLVPADPTWRPATLRHLLTHTAGIGEVLRPSHPLQPVFGELVRAGRPVPSLAEYYRDGLRVGAAPGTRWRYTGHGFAVLGQVVEDVTGQPLDGYLREHVFLPLGMTDTDLIADRLRDRLATGYTVGTRGAVAVHSPGQVAAAAGAACSTPRDMARYLAALLGGGRNEHGTVLSRPALETMFAPSVPPRPLPRPARASCSAPRAGPRPPRRGSPAPLHGDRPAHGHQAAGRGRSRARSAPVVRSARAATPRGRCPRHDEVGGDEVTRGRRRRPGQVEGRQARSFAKPYGRGTRGLLPWVEWPAGD